MNLQVGLQGLGAEGGKASGVFGEPGWMGAWDPTQGPNVLSIGALIVRIGFGGPIY